MSGKDVLRKAYFTAVIVSGAIMVSLAVYLVVVEFLRHGTGWTAVYEASAGRGTLRWAAYGTAALSVILLRLVRGLLMRMSPGEDVAATAQRLLRVSVATSVLSEGPAVLGLVFFLLTGSVRDFYLLLFVSLVLMFMFFPRHRAWMEWMEEAQGGEPPRES